MQIAHSLTAEEPLKSPIILLADDHTLFRKALKNLLLENFTNARIHEVENGLQACEFVKINRVDVVLMDVNMPVYDGLNACKEIKSFSPDQRIVMLTNFDDRNLIQQLLLYGVNGFLLKTIDPKDLFVAISDVLTSGSHVNPILNEVLKRSVGRKASLNFPVLNVQERRLINLLAQGLGSKEISLLMQLTEYTIDSYRKVLLKKTNTRNVAQLVAFGFRTGIVS